MVKKGSFSNELCSAKYIIAFHQRAYYSDFRTILGSCVHVIVKSANKLAHDQST
jgi:hypothetical protein